MDRYEVLAGIIVALADHWAFAIEVVHDDPLRREMTVDLIDPDGTRWTISQNDLKRVMAEGIV